VVTKPAGERAIKTDAMPASAAAGAPAELSSAGSPIDGSAPP
jgi:hypothetical protein